MSRKMGSKVQLPHKLRFLFKPSRYKVAWGGRGGAKSWGFASALILVAGQKKTRILCTREYQNSIQESVHKLLSTRIDTMGYSNFFDIKKYTIVGANGSEFIFAGIKTDPEKVKSMEGIDICWVEEAEKVSERSWEVLIPTIRNPGSEIWVTFNPDEETDPTYKRFRTNPPPHARVVKMNWRDNPWFPQELRLEKDWLASVDVEAYEHVWEGRCRKNSEAQILRGKYVVKEFNHMPHWHGPYYGADWGFGHPTTLMRVWIHDEELYVEYEAWKIKADISDLPDLFDTIPGSRDHVIRGDSARPETISYLQQNGFSKLEAVKKGPGSVEEGIKRLRSFRQIIIHPRCVHTAEEARLWSYRVDKLTNDVMPDPIKKHDNCWDGVRYAIQPLIRVNPFGNLDYS